MDYMCPTPGSRGQIARVLPACHPANPRSELRSSREESTATMQAPSAIGTPPPPCEHGSFWGKKPAELGPGLGKQRTNGAMWADWPAAGATRCSQLDSAVASARLALGPNEDEMAYQPPAQKGNQRASFWRDARFIAAAEVRFSLLLITLRIGFRAGSQKPWKSCFLDVIGLINRWVSLIYDGPGVFIRARRREWGTRLGTKADCVGNPGRSSNQAG